MIKIESKIAGFEVLSDGAEPAKKEAGIKPTLWQRPLKLTGETYKIKPTDGDPAIYVTINKGKNGKIREVFVNTGVGRADLEYAMVLGRNISSVCRVVDDPLFLFKEMTEVHGQSFWAKTGDKSINFNSLAHAVGWCLMQELENKDVPKKQGDAPGSECPSCKAMALVKKDGCDTCMECGYSKCG